MNRNPKVVIIGAGLGGLAAAIELRKAGYADVVIVEKADDVGGVWRENTYPGAACDIPSPFYSYSFEPNPQWPRRFSQQPAILDYIRGVADKYDLRRHLRLGTEVTELRYDEPTSRWTVRCSDGETIVADIVVSAVGQLNRPAFPAIAGREKFAGAAFHSAEWDHTVDLAGKRIAVIGTGASAIQFVPQIQPEAGQLNVFQRSPAYIGPRPDREFSAFHRALLDRFPAARFPGRAYWYGRAESLSVAWAYSKSLAAVLRSYSRWHMKRQTRDKPGLFERVWPDYPMGCKRVLFSSDYLPALTRPNTDLITTPIEEITESGIRTVDGTDHPADVIIWGTGFKATDFLAPMTIIGQGGADLHEQWLDGAHAYYGLTVPNFPNLLIMYGPNTNTGGGSIIYFLETQARYVRGYVDRYAEVGRPLALRPEVEQVCDEEIQAELAQSVWTGCTSWYRTATGRVTTNWPLLGIQYRRRATFDAADYEVVPQ
ncbi:flavin-containing monooxygenase [Skermania piniformis]|uniref:NAD(P)/FAD-dependent oxidoreductase n=1 Tax=Skermania pinensis TaxID=39122 RepID=A0ABX8S588_9ACTN|nr:NAD(P)/FAD-dependent oxidoreductase [Skermania piniformis]QXQ12997.1 NAD(P)/FAD-dependent oxidoreductase [Skermania piniformis]